MSRLFHPTLNPPQKTLTPLKGLISLTKEPDCMTYDDDPDVWRAKMPCGHVFGSESMTMLAQNAISEGRHQFFCPSCRPDGEPCKTEWDYTLVRHVACLDVETQQEFERKLAAVYLKKSNESRECPKCKCFCIRDDPTNNRIVCAICTANQGGADFEFCWICLKKWVNPWATKKCGNDDCGDTASRLKTLHDCPEIAIYGVMCPSRRACVRCGLLIEHNEGCKQMHCKACGTDFCFVCLSVRKNGQWTCGSYNNPCLQAPRQTTLPGK